MSEPDADDVLTAALIQIAGHAERIAELDSREASHHESTGRRVGELGGRAEAIAGRVDAIATILGRHASVINAIDGIDEQVAAIARQIADLAAVSSAAEEDTYQPAPQPRWWQLRDAERANATDRLQAWVEHVYQPGYGHLAAALPQCWERHPLCLYTLDWLSELWTVLYLSSTRSLGMLSAQAEWQTRLLPAAVDQMAREATGCRHRSGQFRHLPPGSGPRHDGT